MNPAVVGALAWLGLVLIHAWWRMWREQVREMDSLRAITRNTNRNWHRLYHQRVPINSRRTLTAITAMDYVGGRAYVLQRVQRDVVEDVLNEAKRYIRITTDEEVLTHQIVVQASLSVNNLEVR